ncbi:MAG TPA: GAF domain-containing protein [Ktedonobacteraceae bacterium]|nr:GAF domain-containing protein [Ktedonobacteraceae bacterium]
MSSKGSSSGKAASQVGNGHEYNDQRYMEEKALEQLRQENNALQRKLTESTQEIALLNDVISTVGSTLKLDEVLRHLVDTIVRATSCHAAFIYLFDREKERLILASTSEQYQHLTGKIQLALGEGIVGWVALTLKPLILKEDALEDPRFQYFPNMDEEKFQSIMTIPIVTKDRRLVGVITTRTVAPYEFTEQHQMFASNVAALVAGAIENAQLYENTQRKLSILTSLSVLSQTLSSGLYLDEMLRSLATLTTQIMECDLSVIMLLDQAKGRLTVRASSPTLNDRALNFQQIDVDRQDWERLRAFSGSEQPVEMSMASLERLDPLKDGHYKALLSAPLIAGTEHLGLINCYWLRARRYTSEDQTLLNTIANQTAIAIKNSHLVDLLAQKNLVKGFFDDLLHGTYDSEESLRQRANFLGCDLNKPHIIVMIEVTPLENIGQERAQQEETIVEAPSDGTEGNGKAVPASRSSASLLQEEERQAALKRISGMVKRRIQENYPGSLVHEHENLLTGVICLSKDPAASRLKTWLRDLTRQMRIDYLIRLSVGVGNPCHNLSDYRRGFAEANDALQMGQSLNREGGVTYFNDLGVYRYLYKIARMDDLRDAYQDQVARIYNYDRRKGTDLLDTLETYLECAGNLTKTSSRLFVHRNTLIQRLERLQSLCEIDLQERSNWLTLQVAIKVFKLRSNGL